MNEHLQAFIRWCAEKELIREMLWRKPTCKIRWEPFKDYPSMEPGNRALYEASERQKCTTSLPKNPKSS